MPYSLPNTPAPTSGPTNSTLGGQGRAGHRRSYMSMPGADYFSSTGTSTSSGRGAFSSLGSLPRRIPPTSPKRSVFHFNDDDSSPSDEEQGLLFHDDDNDDDERSTPRVVKLNPRSSMHMNLTVNIPCPTLPQRVRPGIPFPRTASPGPGLPSPTITTISPAPFSPAPLATTSSARNSSVSGRPPVRPVVNRTASSPVILLSNGKPLKSSLKSSSSSPSIFHAPHIHLNNDKTHLFPPTSPLRTTGAAHIRAASAPASPGDPELGSLSASTSAESLPTTPKNVHFAPRLESVKVFSRLAKPAALLESAGEENGETEDTEDTDPGYEANVKRVGMRRRFSTVGGASYPFPRFLAPAEPSTPAKGSGEKYSIVPHPSSSQIPASLPSPFANVHLEAVSLSHVLPTDGVSAASTGTDATLGSTTLSLSGHVLVRNLAFAKVVAVRFTLDGWQTTSEVGAKYVESMPRLPLTSEANIIPSTTAVADSWDRFAFNINLADYAHMLEERTVWMVVRYTINGGQDEWWDNNSGRNYKLVFCRGQATRTEPVNAPSVRRSRGLSAPAVPSLPSKSFTIGPGAAQRLAIPPYMGAPAPPMLTGGATLEFRNAAIATTRERLARLNLRNYAAPGKRSIPQVPSIDTTPPSPPSFASYPPSTSPAPSTASTSTSPATSSVTSSTPSLMASDLRSSPSASDDEDDGEVTTPDGTSSMPIPDIRLAGKHGVEFPRVEEDSWRQNEPWISGSPPSRNRVAAISSVLGVSPEKQPDTSASHPGSSSTPHTSSPVPSRTSSTTSITTMSRDGDSVTASVGSTSASLTPVPGPPSQADASSISDLATSRAPLEDSNCQSPTQITEEPSAIHLQGSGRDADAEMTDEGVAEERAPEEKTLVANAVGDGSPSVAYETFLREWCFARGPTLASPKGVQNADVATGSVGVKVL